MTEKDKLNLVVLYDVCNEIIDDTKTKSVALWELVKLTDRITDSFVGEIEGYRSYKEYDILCDSMYKELSKLA